MKSFRLRNFKRMFPLLFFNLRDLPIAFGNSLLFLPLHKSWDVGAVFGSDCFFLCSFLEGTEVRMICFLLSCTNSQEFGYLVHGTCFGRPSLLGVDGVHLSEKAKSIFRPSWWRRLPTQAASTRPSQTGLMSCPTTGVQSQERDY